MPRIAGIARLEPEPPESEFEPLATAAADEDLAIPEPVVVIFIVSSVVRLVAVLG